MSGELSRVERRAWLWWLVSVGLHGLLAFGMLRDSGRPPEPGPRLELPNEVQFGLAESASDAAGGTPAPAAAPAEPAAKAHVPRPIKRARAHAPEVAAALEPAAPAANSGGKLDAEAISGMGLFDDAGGPGSGGGPGGNGQGGGLRGGTLALTVDLARIRDSALLLEVQALLEIVPEWQALLAGSGISALTDFDRVFVAAPSRDRSSLIISAEHRLPPERIADAVTRLATERGKPSLFQARSGVSVAAWRNRGATERVIALTGRDQLLITRSADLERVLAVSAALASRRKRQGFSANEIERSGGLLAMQPKEEVALWIENAPSYGRGFGQTLPDSLRLSFSRVDQFHTDLLLTGHYRSAAEAESALGPLETLRGQMSDHARVVYLGLKSAVDAATIEREQERLELRVRLTLHQTRYLMRFLSQVLKQPSREP